MKFVSPLLFAAFLFAACDAQPVVERRFGKKENPQKDTSVLQAADLAGYDGTKLRRRTGALIDASRKRNGAIESALDGK